MFFSQETQRIRRILIVENERLLAPDEEQALKKAGFEIVATVNRFRDATAIILQQVAVDLVITDVRLTGIRSGVELARHARELGIAVLFVSDECPEEAAEQDIALGCLAKPFVPDDLVRAIHVCERLVCGRAPGKLPPTLRLFQSR